MFSRLIAYIDSVVARDPAPRSRWEVLLYPGLWALLPSLGTAALLIAGSVAHSKLHAAIATRPFLFFGRISYAWYLWHWPVLLLGATLVSKPSPTWIAGLVALSLLLAWISHHLIEKPLRHGLRSATSSVVIAVSLLATALAVMAANAWRAEARERALTPPHDRLIEVRSDLPLIYQADCDDWFHSSTLNLCREGEESAQRRLLIIGDSIGLQWYSAIAPYFTQQGWLVLTLIVGGRRPSGGPRPYRWPRRGWSDVPVATILAIRNRATATRLHAPARRKCN